MYNNVWDGWDSESNVSVFVVPGTPQVCAARTDPTWASPIGAFGARAHLLGIFCGLLTDSWRAGLCDGAYGVYKV